MEEKENKKEKDTEVSEDLETNNSETINEKETAKVEESQKEEITNINEIEIKEDSKDEDKKKEREESDKREEKAKVENEETDREEKENNEFKRVEKTHNKSKKTIKVVIAIIILLIAIMLFSVIFALLNINNTKILDGISILDIDVSGLTIEEAKKRVNDAIEGKFTSEKESIILKRGDSQTSVNANTFNAKFDIDTAIAESYNIGRSGNIITNNYSILWTKFFKREVKPTLHYDKEFMKKTISDISSKMSDAMIEFSYYIEGKNLIVVKGKAGYTIQEKELEETIKRQLEDIHNPYTEIEIPVQYKEPSEIDLEKVKKEIYKEAKDAYVEKNPTRVHVEENGVDFGISIEEAKKLLRENKKEYEIPLKITEPKKKLADLGEEAFPDRLSTFSTIYDASAINRAANIELSAKKINGTVIMPGETFSYNNLKKEQHILAEKLYQV